MNRRLHRRLIVCATAVLAVGCTESEFGTNDRAQQDVADRIADGGCDVEYPEWQNSPYVLPFPVGDAHPVGLDNCSSSFHSSGEPDSFAYDFDLDIGDPVTAARGGEVVRLVEDQPDSGGGIGNLVHVDHGDGTVGVYLHFTTDGVAVEVGDVVEPGDLLGASGSSGLAGYPHLHFIVVKAPADYPYVGVPVTFSNMSANPTGPQTGDVVEALPSP